MSSATGVRDAKDRLQEAARSCRKISARKLSLVSLSAYLLLWYWTVVECSALDTKGRQDVHKGGVRWGGVEVRLRRKSRHPVPTVATVTGPSSSASLSSPTFSSPSSHHRTSASALSKQRKGATPLPGKRKGTKATISIPKVKLVFTKPRKNAGAGKSNARQSSQQANPTVSAGTGLAAAAAALGAASVVKPAAAKSESSAKSSWKLTTNSLWGQKRRQKHFKIQIRLSSRKHQGPSSSRTPSRTPLRTSGRTGSNHDVGISVPGLGGAVKLSNRASVGADALLPPHSIARKSLLEGGSGPHPDSISAAAEEGEGMRRRELIDCPRRPTFGINHPPGVGGVDPCGHHPPGVGHHPPDVGHHPPGVGHHPPFVGHHPPQPPQPPQPPKPGHHPPGVGHHPPGVGHHPPGVGRHPPGVGHHQPGVGHHPPGVGHHPPGVGHHPPGVGHHFLPGQRCFGNQTICDIFVLTNPGYGTCCGKACRNVEDDIFHCGRCLNPCSADQLCCGGQCVDILTDSNNCGACFQRCQEGTVCINGACDDYLLAPPPPSAR